MNVFWWTGELTIRAEIVILHVPAPEADKLSLGYKSFIGTQPHPSTDV